MYQTFVCLICYNENPKNIIFTQYRMKVKTSIIRTKHSGNFQSVTLHKTFENLIVIEEQNIPYAI